MYFLWELKQTIDDACKIDCKEQNGNNRSCKEREKRTGDNLKQSGLGGGAKSSQAVTKIIGCACSFMHDHPRFIADSKCETLSWLYYNISV